MRHTAVSSRLTRRVARNALASASVVALAAIFSMTAPQPAHAADECGVEGAGADTVTCTGASYPTGVTYTGSDGISLVLNNPSMVIQKGTFRAVSVDGATANDITVTANSLTSASGGTGSAIVANNDGGGKATIVINAGTFSSTSSQTITALHNSGGGDSTITLNAGQVNNTSAIGGYGLHTQINNASTGNAVVVMTGGSVQTSSTTSVGLRSLISNAASTANSTISISGGTITSNTGANSLNSGAGLSAITMSAGTITAGTGRGLLATNSGSGLAQVTINGGSISASAIAVQATTVTGTGNAIASITNGTISGGNSFAAYGLTAGAGSGFAQATMSGGGITTIGSSGHGLYAASVTGAASATMTGGTIVTNGGAAMGVRAQVTNAASNADASVIFSVGSVTTTNTSSAGLYAQTAGSGAATIQLLGGASGTGGTITSITGAQSLAVSGLSSIQMDAGAITVTTQGLSASSTTGDARVTITGGTITTTANNGHGANAFTGTGAGTITATMSGGIITTNGTLAAGLRSQAFNGTAVVRMMGGTVMTAGTGADGILATNQNGAGSYDISVTGGTVTGGGASSAAVHGYALAGGTIIIGAGATLNAGTSGIALSSMGLNAGAATVTTAGTLNGAIELDEIVANSLTVTGGSIAGNIIGGGNTALSFDLGANGSFTYGAPYTISGVASTTINSGTVLIDGSVNTGTFVVNGGSVNVTGAITPGATATAAGFLSVNGTLNSALAVVSGGRLGGNGTVGATTIQSGGAIAPGNSIGTLHINGAFTQNAGSIYQVEVDPNTSASDLIQVNGTATLTSGAGLNVVKNPAGEYRLGTVYTVLTASGGLTGTYAVTGETSGVSAFLGLRDSYDANNAYLTVVQTRDPADAAQTPNQQAVAENLPGPVTTPVLNLPDDTSARSAFDQLSAQALASAKGALVSNGLYVRDMTLDRLRDVRCGTEESQNARSAACDSERPSLWAQGFGGWGGVSGNANASGLNHTAAGMLAGFDLPIMDWRAGIFAGFSNSDFRLTSGPASGESTDYHLGAYAGTNWDNINVSVGASYTWNAIRTDRTVTFGTFTDRLQALTNAGVTQVFAEAGYGMEMMGITLEPFANLAYLNLRTDDFTEVGGAAALTSQADTIENVITTFGIRPSTTVDLGNFPVTLRGMAGWRHTFGTVTPTSTVAFAGGNAFTISGAPIARDAVALEAGVDFAVADNISAGLTYGGQLSSRTTDQTARGTIRISF